METKEFKKKYAKSSSTLDVNRMDYIVEKSIESQGEELSNTIIMEELSELIKETSKQTRKKGNWYDLLQEMADVIICLEFLKSEYNISSRELQQAINVKLDRLYKRNVLKEKED